MAKGKQRQNQQHTSGTSDAEFATELTQSKKARKRAARESKNNS